MQGVLYISHGTRLEQGREEAVHFLESIQEQVGAPLQEICFLEINTPTIADGVKKLVARGATAIAVVPVLLLRAKHDKEDIPQELKKVQQNHPAITFTYGEPLGVQDRLIDILEERVLGKVDEVSSEAAVLLVGRGSREPSVKADIALIADKLGKRVGRRVDIAFLAACEPSFDEMLTKAAEKKQPYIVVPYLWFNGLLLRSMQKQIDQLNQTGVLTVLCDQLGHHPNIKQALIDRANQALQPVLKETANNE